MEKAQGFKNKLKKRVKVVNPRDAGRKAFKEFLAGASRDQLLIKLQERFGVDGLFAFGQAEYYYKHKAS